MKTNQIIFTNSCMVFFLFFLFVFYVFLCFQMVSSSPARINLTLCNSVCV